LVQATRPNKTVKAELVNKWNDYYVRAKKLALQAERLGFKQALSEKEKHKPLLDSLLPLQQRRRLINTGSSGRTQRQLQLPTTPKNRKGTYTTFATH
jgi:hypothetical protein